MPLARLMIVLLLFPTLSLSTVGGASALEFLTEDSPPLNYIEDGKPTGLSVAIVQELILRTGMQARMQFLPWARAYRRALIEPSIALFSTTRTASRESLFYWVGPIAIKRWVFFARADSLLHLESLEDAKKVRRIGAYVDSGKTTFLQEQGFTNLDIAPAANLNPRKLIAGRIDLWIKGELEGLVIARAEGIAPEKLKVVYPIKSGYLYLAFSKRTPKPMVAAFTRAYRAMLSDGSLIKYWKTWLPDSNMQTITTEATRQHSGLTVKALH